MSLQSQIDKKRKEIHSDRLSMSIGELAGLYDRGELDIHPKFQRFLRWSPEQKTKLIESILLRIPVPPIFIAQDENGLWDVVDGVQRLGTIFEFLGILRGVDKKKVEPLILTATSILPELEGKRFKEKSPTSSFSGAEQLDFSRSRLDLHVILKESDPSAKYELFERLNTGGSLASAQEVRNCVLVWINEPYYDWMQKLCQNIHFINCVQLSERLEEQQYRMEILLRFLAFRRMNNQRIEQTNFDDLSEYLNKQNRAMALKKDFDHDLEEYYFENTFALLDQALGADAFRKYDASTRKFIGGFLISAFEAVALGVAENVEKWLESGTSQEKLTKLVKSLWAKREFTEHIGIGVAARARIKYSIGFGRSHFSP